MSGIILPHRLRHQPQSAAVTVDWGNPITRGLEFIWLGSDPGRIISRGKVALASNTCARGARSFGRVAQPSGAGVNMQTARNAVLQSNTWTGVAHFSVTGATSSLFQCVNSAGSSTNDRSLGVDGSGQLSAYIWDGAAKTATDPDALTYGNEYVAAASSSGSTLEVWKEGAKVASTATSNGGFTGYTSPGPIFVAGYGFGQITFSAGSNASIGVIAWWSRYLSAAEHAQLADNPYCIFRQRQRMWAMEVAASMSTARPQVFVAT